jgi:hypothetical protein
MAITGSGARAITGGGGMAITGSGARAITGGGGMAITGSGARAITGGGGMAITGSGALLVLGRVSYVGEDFISVLGQSVFAEPSSISGLRAGSTVAVFGSIDIDTGGIVGASIVDADSAGFASGTSYLTGIVDAVDSSKGMAMVSGVAVDYTGLLSNGAAPSVGDMVSVAGYSSADSGLLVADPSVTLETR